jgi:preprotein translocase subunit YajC
MRYGGKNEMTMHMLTLGQAAPGGGSSSFMFVWLGLMLAIFWVILIRPQQRREKQRKAMLAAVKTGDRVVFSGGIIGIVANVKEKTISIKIADNVKIEVGRSAVSQILDKGDDPADAAAK